MLTAERAGSLCSLAVIILTIQVYKLFATRQCLSFIPVVLNDVREFAGSAEIIKMTNIINGTTLAIKQTKGHSQVPGNIALQKVW
jgi:hypothetical protein